MSGGAPHSWESSIAWLDFTEDDRQRVQEHVALLSEPGTLDELGIGQVRDVFSHLLFPGTSTLWRRARYMLFIPWVYRDLELRGTERLSAEVAARRKQQRLIRALKVGAEDTEGLIGKQKDEPVRLPDELVWNGLRVWGVRRRHGSLGKYRRMLERGDASRFELVRGALDEAIDAESGSWWHEALPKRPADLYESTDFLLSWGEADFLRSRLEATNPRALLTELLAAPGAEEASDWPWEASDAISRLDAEMQEAIDHARVFAFAIEGAALLYNLLIARAKNATDAIEDFTNRLSHWIEELDATGVDRELVRWGDRAPAFWSLIRKQNPGLRGGTQPFIDHWIELVASDGPQLGSNHAAEELIRNREWRVKRQLARLSSTKALDQAREEAGVGRLSFRWTQAKRIVADIRAGLRNEEGP